METTEKRKTIQMGLLMFWIYFKCMLFAFTGGASIVPLLTHEIVQKRHLLSQDDYDQIIALAQTLPGVISLHNAHLTGYKIGGWFCAMMAAIGTILPALGSMLLVAILFQSLTRNRIVMGAIRGIRAVSVAILLDTGIRIIWRRRKSAFSILLALAALAIPLIAGVSSFWAILICGAAGILVTFLRPQMKDSPRASGEEGDDE